MAGILTLCCNPQGCFVHLLHREMLGDKADGLPLLIQVALAGYQICPSTDSESIFPCYFGVSALDHQPFLPEDGKVSCCATAAAVFLLP